MLKTKSKHINASFKHYKINSFIQVRIIHKWNDSSGVWEKVWQTKSDLLDF